MTPACIALGLVPGLLLACSLAGAAIPQQPDAQLREALVQAVGQAESFGNRFEAEVWLLDMSTRLRRILPDAQKRVRLLQAVHREASLAELKPELVLSVIHVESLFNRFAISSAGARGLMQIMPFWMKEIGRPDDDLFDLDTNLRYGCTILRFYLDKEKGNLSRALARYNGSLGKYWYPARVNAALRKHWYPQ